MNPLETISPDEEKLSNDLLRILTLMLRKEYPKGKTVLRDAHPKSHGLVKAEFVVPELPTDLKVGLFSKPGTYKAYIRFSNGAKPQADKIGDIRGVGIKIFGVEGEHCLEGEKTTQDFLLINNPVLPAGNPKDYFNLFTSSMSGNPLKYFFSWNPFEWKIGDLLILHDIRSQKVPSPLSLKYYSTTPYAWKEGAVKYALFPTGDYTKQIQDDSSENYLREQMKKELSEKSASFDFNIQKGDLKVHSIENASAHWDEGRAPFQKLATILIPKQNFDTPDQNTLAENLSFDPWHSLVDHTPIGGINRMRKVVYYGITKYRHEKNGVGIEDPIPWESID